MLQELSFREIPSNEDLREYHDLARDRFNGIDMVTEVAMASMLEHRTARLWELSDKGRRVGYCSILIQSPDNPHRSVHFLNMFVLDGCEGKGYGSAMMQFRIDAFGDLPLVVAVRPDNERMMRLSKKFGFRPGFQRDIWTVMHRPTTASEAVLLRHAQGGSNRATAIRDALADRGLHVELQEIGTTRRHPITGAAWPDPAAFPTVLTLES